MPDQSTEKHVTSAFSGANSRKCLELTVNEYVATEALNADFE